MLKRRDCRFDTVAPPASLWRYDLRMETWSLLLPKQGPNPFFVDHASALDSTRGYLYVFGGWGDQGPTNDFWRYDLYRTQQWTLLRTGNDPSIAYSGYTIDAGSWGQRGVFNVMNYPAARVSHVMTVDERTGNLYMHGGVFDNACTS